MDLTGASDVALNSSNCTLLELKEKRSRHNTYLENVLIVPYWN